MTLFVQAFQPVNHLKWQNFGNWILEDIPNTPDIDGTLSSRSLWRFQSYGEEVRNLRNNAKSLRASGNNANIDQARALENQAYRTNVSAVDLVNEINSFRFYVGLTVGMF